MSTRPNFEQVIITPPRVGSLKGLALVADTQYLEPLASNSLNRKFAGIVERGVFRGFECQAMGDLRIRVHSDGHAFGVALVERDDYVLTVRQQHEIFVEIPVSPVDKQYHIVLEAFYKYGVVTKQVDLSSYVEAAEIKLVEVGQELPHHLILTTLNVAAGALYVTDANLSFEHRNAGGYELDAHQRAYNPHNVNKEMIELGNVNNWPATSEITVDDGQIYATAKGLKRLHDKVIEALNRTVTHWEYTAIGGEVEVELPYVVADVDSVHIQGMLQTKSKAWEFDAAINAVRFAESLEEDDAVVITLGTPSVDATLMMAEMRTHIAVLEDMVDVAEEAKKPLSVVNGVLANDTDTYTIPSAFNEKEIKLIFIQGTQQTEGKAYSVDRTYNVIRFAVPLTAGTEITIVG